MAGPKFTVLYEKLRGTTFELDKETYISEASATIILRSVSRSVASSGRCEKTR